MTDKLTTETAVQPNCMHISLRLQTILGTLAAVAVIVAYVGTINVADAAKCGALAAIALMVGGVVGLLARRFDNVLFWTGIGVAYGYLTILQATAFHWTAGYAWPLVGGLVGATAALCSDGKTARRMACCALAAVGPIFAYESIAFGFQRDLLPDWLCAAVGGALMGAGVELVEQFEKRVPVPRFAVAIGLAAVGIVGHALAIRFIPGL